MEHSQEQHLFEINLFCNIINVCHFWSIIASLMNKYIYFTYQFSQKY